MSNTAEVRMSAGDTVDADMTGNEKTAKRKKNKFQKRLLRFLKWFAIVFAVLLLLLLIFRDSIIKSCISHIGSNLAGTDITIEELKTTLDGEIRITNLTIANPHGFREKNMLTVSSVYVNIGIASLFSDEFVVEEADINELKLNWEFKSRSGSNNIQTFADKFKNDDADNDSSTKATIHKFALRNSSISISNEEDNFLIGIGELTGSTSAG
ncbi:MAG: hypothetical protein IKZ31_03565, partial [Lentisphaeria bacterium]|nr:hypothetical protein [Lentisphaeria bacterium]